MNIADIAKEVYAESDNPDRYTLINTIIGRIDPGDYREYLADALRQLTPNFTARFRNQAMRVRGVVATQPERVDYDGLEPVTPTTEPVRKFASWKVAQSYSRWENFLEEVITIEDGTRIFLKDAVVADLLYNAGTRFKQADGLRVQGEMFERLADGLKKSGRERLGDVNLEASLELTAA